MKISFNNLNLSNSIVENEILTEILKIIRESAFIGGESVDDFEIKFAEKLRVKHCIGVSNGTAALWISLKALGIGEGDEVIVPANTFFACAEAVETAGAKPVFCDNDEYFNIDVTKLENLMSERTKAIMVVHLYGQACDIDEIKVICKKYNLFLIEDCSQAHFSKYKNEYCGSFGDIATFSFYPGKNLGAMGDAGAIVTNNDDYAEKCRLFRNHGEAGKSNHVMIGFNCRLDAIQAAVLKVKLKYIDEWNRQRNEIASIYVSELGSCDNIVLPKVKSKNYHSFHLFVILAEKRYELKNFLQSVGISTGIHYPLPIPLMPIYKDLWAEHIERLRMCISYSEKLLSLPIFPGMTKEEVMYVTKMIKQFYEL